MKIKIKTFKSIRKYLIIILVATILSGLIVFLLSNILKDNPIKENSNSNIMNVTKVNNNFFSDIGSSWILYISAPILIYIFFKNIFRRNL